MEPKIPPAASPDDTTLSGFVERVTFHSEESGFTVLRVKARGHRELVTVVSTSPEVNPGEWIEARGAWGVDPRHGPQFQAATLEMSRPDTVEGIERYLGSGLIKGIGPHYAKRLVGVFGRDVFEVIEKQSARLMEVEGIGRTRRDRIKAAWNEQKTVREIMTFLFTCGVSTARAYRIYKTYGEKAVERVRLDPYCLARDIRGIGFLTADQIAMRLGIEKQSILRARAGIEYVLLELSTQGHCAYPREGLLRESERILDIDAPTVEAALAQALAEKRVVEYVCPDGTPLIYPAPLEFAERELAHRLLRLAQGAHPLAGVDVDKAVEWVEGRIRLTLDPTQREAVRAALREKFLVLTGGPGVGKTTLINALVQIFRAKRLRVLLCAPTGRAAKRLAESTHRDAKTIHRLLLFDPATGDFKYNERHPLNVDLLVVDETSMLDVDLSWRLIRAVPNHAAVVFVGDIDQLPSVGPGSVLRDMIDSERLAVCRLQHVFRQAAQSHIVTNAHRINRGEMPWLPQEEDREELADFYFIEAEEKDKLLRVMLKMIQESIPRRFHLDPLRDVQVLTPMQRGELGARNLNQVLQAALNPTGAQVERFGVTFRVGDKVMQIQNNYDKDVYNGDIGRIAAVDEANRELRVTLDGREIVYDWMELDELVPAYATTIHKSQGSEYPCVVIPVHTQHFIMLQRNLLYTAVTRARKLVVLIGTKKALAIAIKRADAQERVTRLKERLRQETPR